MKHGLRWRTGTLVVIAMMSMTGTLAYAQGSTTSTLSGVVIDSGGGVIPGANVVVKNNATGTTFNAVTNSTGAFALPALDAGTYTVTVSVMGFKTAVMKDVRLLAAIPADVKVTLEVGNLEETVTVVGGTELVQTRSPTISSTMTVDQIQNLPLPTRNAVNFATFLPGVNTTGVNRDANFNGLPDSAVAITLDGVNNNENFNKSTEGLFAMVTPRQDAVEAVTVTTGTPGADSGGHGAIMLRFVTRGGTDRFSGSVYEYYRSSTLNTNYYFNTINNLPKNDVTLNQYGFRVGGPIVIPKVYNGRGKAFFFFNYEELRLPNEYSRTRTMLNPLTETGVFRYNVTVGGQQVVREVNVLALAAARGQLATTDPTVMSVLAGIRAAAQTTGTITQSPDPNTMAYDFLSGGNQYEKQPTTRIDYNLNNKHRLTGTYIWQVLSRDPDHLNGTDVRFPGLPSYRKYLSYRKMSSGALRSAFSGNVVNELRGGIKWGPSYFGRPEWNGPEMFQNQDGRALVLGNVGQTLTNIYVGGTNSLSARSAWSWNIDDTVNWQRRSHSLSFGGSFFSGHVWVTNQTMVPQINFGVDASDPATAMFTTANFAGASAAQLTTAANLYALLTGRVTAIAADARLDETTNQYVLLGPRTQRLKQDEMGFFVQDAWRVNQQMTISAGLRWDVQFPIEPTNDIMSTSTYADLCGISGVGANGECNLFKPGTVTGAKPVFVGYDKGNPGYKTDWTNFAPNIGVAWRPGVETGFLRRILGNPEQATIRGGYSVAYNREGMALFTGVIGASPGSTIQVQRNTTLGNIVPAGETWPVLLRDASRLALPSFATAPNYPIAATTVDSINIFDPAIQVAFARSLTVSFQRALSKDMAVEVRYVGTFGRNIWANENYNEVNIQENGFLDEFKRAQTNLQANIAAGKGNTFAYTGVAGTSPLPIFLAYFNAVPNAQSGDQTKYTGSSWTNTTFISRLATQNPQPFTSAQTDLQANATRRANALAAGLPVNLFILNPDVNQANVYTSKASTKYNALQLDVRRRLSAGLQFSANYQYAVSYNSQLLGQRYGRVDQLNVDVPRHAFKVTWDWSVPVGRDRRFGTDMARWLDAVVGGWEFHGAGRIQNRLLDFGNVNLVGMTLKELRDMYKIRYATDAVTGVKTVWMLPEDVILNTRRAFNTSATSATGYSDLGVPEGPYLAPANGPNCIQLKAGDCAPLHQYVMSSIFTRIDVSLVKRFRLVGRSTIELRLDVMNVFNNINFTPVAQTGTGATINQVTGAYQDNSNTFDPGGRLGQIGIRFSW